jgi:hypothetical protein
MNQVPRSSKISFLQPAAVTPELEEKREEGADKVKIRQRMRVV